jgi:hypothetical protein
MLRYAYRRFVALRICSVKEGTLSCISLKIMLNIFRSKNIDSAIFVSVYTRM